MASDSQIFSEIRYNNRALASKKAHEEQFTRKRSKRF